MITDDRDAVAQYGSLTPGVYVITVQVWTEHTVHYFQSPYSRGVPERPEMCPFIAAGFFTGLLAGAESSS